MALFPCFDSSAMEFWWPENWPGGLAPCRWRIERMKPFGPDRYPEYWSCSVQLWVPFGRDGRDDDMDLWSISSTARGNLAEAFRLCKRWDRELRDERDEHLAAKALLDSQFAEFQRPVEVVRS